jgi:NitT/TauT family transport system permease protein
MDTRVSGQPAGAARPAPRGTGRGPGAVARAERPVPPDAADRWVQGALVLAILVGAVALWQGVVVMRRVPPFLVPAPAAVARAALAAVRSGVLVPALAVTLYETLGGFALGSALALLLAVLITHSRVARLGLYPYVVAFQSIPKVAIAPLLVVWFGFGVSSKIVTAALVALFPVLVNTIAGLEAADAGHLELMRAVCASRWQTFRWVRWPACLPFLFAGLETGLIFSLIGAIVAEFVGAKAGLGTYILNLQFTMDTAGVFAGLLVLSATGVVLHGILRAVGRRVVFWTRVEARMGA